MAVPSRHGRHARGRHSARSVGAVPSRRRRMFEEPDPRCERPGPLPEPPGRHPEPPHRRSEPARRRRTAPVAAFVAVLAVAAGGAWALGARDGGSPRPTQEAGLLAESRDGARTTPSGETTATPADRASRGSRPPAAPPLGPVAAAATTTAPAPTAGPRTTTAPRPPSTRPTSAPAPRPSSSPAPTAPTASTASTAEAEVTRLTNVERAKAGCGALRVDARLTAAAQAHSRDMVDRDYFSHTSPEGTGPGDRAAAAGYRRWSGENIAAGYPTPEAVVRGWMNSAGHKANILNCQSKATGVGYDEREDMWTQMFGFE